MDNELIIKISIILVPFGFFCVYLMANLFKVIIDNKNISKTRKRRSKKSKNAKV